MGKLKNTLLKAKQCIPDFLSDLHESISALIAIVCVTAIASLTIILMIEVQYYFIIVAIALIALREFLERYKKKQYDVFVKVPCGGCDLNIVRCRVIVRGRNPLDLDYVETEVAKYKKVQSATVISYHKVDN